MSGLTTGISPRTAAILALILSGVGVVVWIGMPDEHWPSRAILVLTIAFVVGTLFDLARFPGTSRTESTMGPVGDALIGFQASVLSVEPLRVEARGAVWSARLVGELAVSQQARVEVVGRDGLTLLVRPADETKVN
jgi:membrane protein implicated in regulation of membrane protease activity